MVCTGATGTSGRDLCDLLTGVGTGLGIFLDSISGAFAVFLILLAVVGGVIAIFYGIATRVKSARA